MTDAHELPTRAQVALEDTWDLSGLFASDDAWEKALTELEGALAGYAEFRGKLGDGPATLARCLTFDLAVDRLAERVGSYAFLKESEDATDSLYQGGMARYQGVAAKAAEAASYIRPELTSLSDDTLRRYLQSSELAEYKLLLERFVRYKPHTLTPAEERLLALQAQMADAAHRAFHQLTNSDMKFGAIEIEPGKTVALTHASFSTCLHKPDREVRQRAFRQYYQEFSDHANTLAATLAGSIQRDVYYARARNYGSALEAGLFDDRVSTAVYDNLIAAVRGKLPAVHRYFEVRRRAMGLADLHHYDTYAPIVADLETSRTWDEAVDLTLASLAPLGADYVDTLAGGLRGRWCDRYENRGKRSGAFSAGSFDGDPYILMNYQADVLDHVFTLAHEAGHSMHSYYSARRQPYQYYNYTIFVAEVASTFNEQLLSHYLLERASSNRERAYYINREIDAMRGTIVRQTMFAEFEKRIHRAAEANEPISLEFFKTEYRKLLEAYFGPKFALDDELALECLRIPHFYRAFYVYKYATGMSAAVALADRVLNGGAAELSAYRRFLESGCSKYPLDLLRDAGVDMETPQPVDAALARFERLVDELERLLA